MPRLPWAGAGDPGQNSHQDQPCALGKLHPMPCAFQRRWISGERSRLARATRCSHRRHAHDTLGRRRGNPPAAKDSPRHFHAERLHELPWAHRTLRPAHPPSRTPVLRPMPRAGRDAGPIQLFLRSPMSPGISRRGLFTILGRAARSFGKPAAPALGATPDKLDDPTPAMAATDQVAVIQGRFCLAYTSFCTVCSERCPVPGAIRLDKGIPMVVAERCDGCGVCHTVCPAPTKAAMLLPRRKGGRLGKLATPLAPA